MKIIKISKSNKKYKIELENSRVITTYDDVIIKNNLLFHKEVDSKTLEKINNDTAFYDAYNKTLAYINKRLRSEYEVEQYLEKYDITTNEKKEIIDKLKKINLINDEYFAQAYINDKINFSSNGPDRIKKDLEELRVDEEIIEKQIRKIEEEVFGTKIKSIIEKKIKANKKYSNNILKQKIMYELLSSGYPKEMITNQLEMMTLKNDIEQVYTKIQSKLQKKYQGSELELHMRQKLYSLGYTSEEINQIIAK